MEILFVLACVVLMAAAFRGSFWKKGKKPRKPRRPLPRKGPFRVSDNPFKAYRPPRADFQAVAHQRAAERRANPTKAERAFHDVLNGIGLVEHKHYEREHVQFYPGSYSIFDFYFPAHRVACEIDGSAHHDHGQARHDQQRDAYFSRHGIKTLRFTNRTVLTHPEVCRKLLLLELGGA